MSLYSVFLTNNDIIASFLFDLNSLIGKSYRIGLLSRMLFFHEFFQLLKTLKTIKRRKSKGTKELRGTTTPPIHHNGAQSKSPLNQHTPSTPRLETLPSPAIYTQHLCILRITGPLLFCLFLSLTSRSKGTPFIHLLLFNIIQAPIRSKQLVLFGISLSSVQTALFNCINSFSLPDKRYPSPLHHTQRSRHLTLLHKETSPTFRRSHNSCSYK